MKVKNVIINYPTDENYKVVEEMYLSKLAEILLRKLKTEEEVKAFSEVFMREEVSF